MDQGQYIGGVYNPPSANVEYNRRLGLFNAAKSIHGLDSDMETILEDARKLETFLLGTAN